MLGLGNGIIRKTVLAKESSTGAARPRLAGLALLTTLVSACWMIAGLEDRSPAADQQSGGDGGPETGTSVSDGGGDAPTAGLQGTVVDPAGHPVVGAVVHVAAKTATSDAKGAFAFDVVDLPYDVTVQYEVKPDAVSTGKALITFLGLGTRTPTLQTAGEVLSPNSAPVTASLSNLALTAEEQWQVAFETPSRGAALAGPATPLTGPVAWTGPPGFNAKAFAFVVSPAAGLPATLDAYGEKAFGLVSGAGSAVSVAVPVAGDVARGSLNGTIALPAGFESGSFAAYLDPSPSARATFAIKSAARFATFNLPTLATNGATAGVSARALGLGDAGQGGAVAEAWRMGLAPMGSFVALAVPSPPQLLTPAPDATTDALAADFTWVPMPGSVHHLDVACFAGGTSPVYRAAVFVMGSTAKLASILPLAGATRCDWAVSGYAASSMDNLVTPLGWLARTGPASARIDGHAAKTAQRTVALP
jgi:hypothetical protein